MPYAPRPDDGRVWHKYDTPTYEGKLVASYAGISIQEARRLDWIDYMILRREAVISALSKSEDGIKYLDEAWAYEQTAADTETLLAEFG